ncbi:MAG: serine/threonine-protein kinase [Labilithrix sp.]
MSALRRGDRFRDYEIVAKLRAGGMATLYLGCRRGAAGFSRPVAIKIIHPHLARDPAFVKMFIDEAKLSARIEDPHVVHVEDLGEANGALFLAMEYVPGCSLSQLLAALAKEGRRLDASVIVHLGAQIASGLQAAHETTDEHGAPLGVVHRDVSPSNVLIARKGHVKLIDFGIAKVRSRAQQQTNTKALKGKLAYMSPEQARLEPVDLRTDLYALGVMLWELVTMKRCFEAASDIRLLEMVRQPSVVRPSTYASVDPALESVIMWALEPDPSKRPQTAADLRRRLLEAVPATASVDRAAIALLVERLLGDKLDKEQKLLPVDEHVYGEVAEAAEVAREAEATVTSTSTAAGESTVTSAPATVPNAAAVTATMGNPAGMAFAPTERAPFVSNIAQERPERRWETLTQAATVMPARWEEPASTTRSSKPLIWILLIAAAGAIASVAVVLAAGARPKRAAANSDVPSAIVTVATMPPPPEPEEVAAVPSASAAQTEPTAPDVTDAGAPTSKRPATARGHASATAPPLPSSSARKPVQMINGVPINTDLGL